MRNVWQNGHRTRREGRRDGSTFILVLAVLSILILIAATLSYTARLEDLSARNFGEGVQARLAAQTAVASFFAAADGRTSSVLSPWAYSTLTPRPESPFAGQVAPLLTARERRLRPGVALQAAPTTGALPLSDPSRSPISSVPDPGEAGVCNVSTIATGLASAKVVDESSKMNVNAAGSWAELGFRINLAAAQVSARTGSANRPTSSPFPLSAPIGLADSLYAILSSPEVRYPGVSRQMTRDLAASILRYRYGPDGQPGAAGVDDDGDGVGGVLGTRSGMTALPTASIIAQATAAGVRTDTQSGLAAPTASAVSLPPISIEQDGLDNDFDGAKDEPGEGIDEPDEFEADPRRPPRGDDRPFRTVEELLAVEGMTPEILQALRPYVTVFSISERRSGPERDALAPMDLNRAGPEEIYERLRAIFAAESPEACAQFAANMADYRDADSVPTLVNLESAAEPILGVEVTPYITEVWPDSTTDDEDGDDGEFIEVFNPYDAAISLEGWSLHLSAGARVALRGTLPPGGFLIVTDDYNEQQDPTPEDDAPDYGSFYDIFQIVPNYRNRLMIEVRTLDLPNGGGWVELREATGKLIDRFQYGGNATGGLRRSYQRTDPRIRQCQVARCTPYAIGTKGTKGTEGTAQAEGVYAVGNLIAAASIKNAPFESALELFTIGSSYISAQTQGEAVWRTPTIGNLEMDTFDERLVDIFTVWVDRRPVAPEKLSVMADSPLTSGFVGTLGPAARPSSLSECGRINLNSAPTAVLRTLPGLTDQAIRYLIARRMNAQSFDAAGLPIVYSRWSELLADDAFWGSADPSWRLGQLAAWMNSVAFNSKSYRITSENRPSPASGPRLASRSKIEAVVSVDGGQNRVVVWRYME